MGIEPGTSALPNVVRQNVPREYPLVALCGCGPDARKVGNQGLGIGQCHASFRIGGKVVHVTHGKPNLIGQVADVQYKHFAAPLQASRLLCAPQERNESPCGSPPNAANVVSICLSHFPSSHFSLPPWQANSSTLLSRNVELDTLFALHGPCCPCCLKDFYDRGDLYRLLYTQRETETLHPCSLIRLLRRNNPDLEPDCDFKEKNVVHLSLPSIYHFQVLLCEWGHSGTHGVSGHTDTS